MRIIIAFLLAAALLSAPCAAADVPEESFALGCTAAALMERETGDLLYAKNEHRHLSPASVTKVMTLLLTAEAVDSGAVNPGDMVTASARAASMGGSQVWLKEGERMTVAEMTKCVAVVSANDCAVALAEHLCGSEEAFTARMNRRAAELGMEDTHFTNCTGLFEDPEHYTSAYDVALMSRELLGHDFVRQFTSIWTDTIRGGAFGLTNTNRLVRFYPDCTGLKTGFTSRAMFCLAASAQRDGVEYVAVILHDETSQRRFDDARTLLDYAFANYTLVRPSLDGARFVPVTLGEAERVEARLDGERAVVVPRAAVNALETEITLPGHVDAPVERGQTLGTMTLRADGRVVAETPLLAAEDVGRIRLFPVWAQLVRTLCGQ